MGVGSTLEGYWNTVQPYLDPGNLLAGGPKQQNAGGSVGGARPQDAYALQAVPGTNYSYDPQSGQYYLTPPGQNYGATSVAAAPNLAQQGAGATAMQSLYLQQQQDAVARAAATRAGQGALESNLKGVVAGTAPSVAATQLTTGMERIAGDQNSMAAGANGQNAFAARRAAAQNIARSQGDLSGQQALVRAGESAAARSGLASLYGTEAQADTAASNIAAGTALGYGGLGEKAEADRVGANTAAQAEYDKQRASVLMGVGGGLQSLYGGKSG